MKKNPTYYRKPYFTESEYSAINAAASSSHPSGFVGSISTGAKRELYLPSREITPSEDSSSFLGGESVILFEQIISASLGIDYAVTFNSGTSAIRASLLATGLEPGDEVITTPFTFTATTAAIVSANCIPIFADIDPQTFCLDPTKIEKLISPKTKAVLHVEWCGSTGHLKSIRDTCQRLNLILIEDAAQAHFVKWNNKYLGTNGHIGIFSFNEAKSLSCAEGGACVTNDAETAARLRLFRNHGEIFNSFLHHNNVGQNYRMPNILAAIGIAQFRRRKQILDVRTKNINLLRTLIKEKTASYIEFQQTEGSSPNYCLAFRICDSLADQRDLIIRDLLKKGVPFQGSISLPPSHRYITERIAWGSSGFPWNMTPTVHFDLPVTTALNRVYLSFFALGYPNRETQMEYAAECLNTTIENYV